MAGSIDLALNVKNARLQTIADLVNVDSDGDNPPILRMYDGAKPPNVETLVTTQVLGIETTTGFPVEAEVVGGVLTLAPITPGIALADITITWARLFTGIGEAPLIDFTVGEEGSNSAIEVTQTNLLTGVIISITSATIAEL